MNQGAGNVFRREKKQARYLLTLSQENPNMNMSMNMDMDMETDTYVVDMTVLDMDVYTNMEGVPYTRIGVWDAP